MALAVIQDLKTTKKSIDTKTKRFQYDLEQKGKCLRFLSFWFCPRAKIENSEMLEIFIFTLNLSFIFILFPFYFEFWQ